MIVVTTTTETATVATHKQEEIMECCPPPPLLRRESSAPIVCRATVRFNTRMNQYHEPQVTRDMFPILWHSTADYTAFRQAHATPECSRRNRHHGGVVANYQRALIQAYSDCHDNQRLHHIKMKKKIGGGAFLDSSNHSCLQEPLNEVLTLEELHKLVRLVQAMEEFPSTSTCSCCCRIGLDDELMTIGLRFPLRKLILDEIQKLHKEQRYSDAYDLDDDAQLAERVRRKSEAMTLPLRLFATTVAQIHAPDFQEKVLAAVSKNAAPFKKSMRNLMAMPPESPLKKSVRNFRQRLSLPPSPTGGNQSGNQRRAPFGGLRKQASSPKFATALKA